MEKQPLLQTMLQTIHLKKQINISMETIFINTENSKIKEPQKFILNLPQILDSKSSNQHAALQNLSTYYT